MIRASVVDDSGKVIACIMVNDIREPLPDVYKNCTLIDLSDAGVGDTYLDGVLIKKPLPPKTAQEISDEAMKASYK